MSKKEEKEAATTYCGRTGRLCVGGAWDGGDGEGVDCLAARPDDCPHRS